MTRSSQDDRLLQWRSRSGALEQSGPAQRALLRKVQLNRWALLIERLWPMLWLPAAVVGVFLLVSLFGLWPLMSQQAHGIVLTGFGLALLASLIPIVRVRWPSREEGLHRLERLSNVPHRPASAYDDQLSDGTMAAGPTGRLWQAHRQRLERLIAGLKPRGPMPRVEARDPFALRAVIVLGVVLGAVVAGDAFKDRLIAPFRLVAGQSGSAVRLDAWVTPPIYTGLQPMLLIDGAKLLDPDGQSTRIVTVPEGSLLAIRAAGEGRESFSAQVAGADGKFSAIEEASAADTPTGVTEYRSSLLRDTTVKVLNGNAERLSWQFKITPDRAPIITLSKPPSQGVRGALILEYRVQDDFGVSAANADIELKEPPAAKPLRLADGSEIGPLAKNPSLTLKLPKSKSRRDVRGKTSQDLTAHPWAGQAARLVLSARDQAGKVGTSPPIEMTMPARNFQNPLARAVVEQRRKLALSPALYRDVRFALDAITIAPEKFIQDNSVYLGLRSAYHRLHQTPTVEGLQSVVDQLWQIALKIEDGDLSEAEQRLRNAQDELMKALENGASDAEIQKLMEELKQAMNEFLRSLAEQAEQNPEQSTAENEAQQRMSAKDLQDMLEQIEKLSRSGSKEAAQQLLSELRDMLDRMQAGRMAKGGPGDEMRQMMEQFSNMISKQRKLLDKTFRAGRDRGKGSESGGQNESEGSGEGQGEREWQSQLEELSRDQAELRRQLEQLLGEMDDLDAKARERLKGAGRDMEEAERALEEGEPESATEEQARALEQLRRGAQAMTEQMTRGANGQLGSRGGNDDRDPFGRAWKSDGPELDGGNTKVPRDIDIQRSRRILEELRKRLGETTRSPLELDYLERLLK